MTRTENREALMKWLYECDMKDELDQFDKIPFTNRLSRKTEKIYAQELTKAFIENQKTIDSKIEENTKDWRIARIGKIELAILRLAITELLYLTDIPVPVVVTQAIELSRRYASDDSTAFINGILGAVADGKK